MKMSSTRTSSETWLQRARAMASEPTMADRTSTFAQEAAEQRQAWDPYEVWLRRIREPQERRNGTQR
jgi:uncharacterized protein HemY